MWPLLKPYYDHHMTIIMSNAWNREYKRGNYHCTIDLLFDWFEFSVLQIKTKIVSCHTADSKPVTGGQLYSDFSPFSIPCLDYQCVLALTLA